MLLNESGIRLPKGSKSAKVLAHVDLDGFMSALLTINQLVKQGISKDRIDVQWVQYGDNDLLDKAVKKNRYQALLAVDFSAFPVVDLWSTFSKLTKETKGIKGDFKSEYPRDKFLLNKYLNYLKYNNLKVSSENFKEWVAKNVNPNADVIKNTKEVYEDLNKFIRAVASYKEGEDKTNVKIAKLDHVSDHHDNTKGNLTPGKAGRIGRTQYRSDAEHISTVSAQNLIRWGDLDAVSRVDSANYTNLDDTIALTKDLVGKDRKERLAILVSALVTTLISSNKMLATRAVKEASPSLLSVYNTVMKISKLNDNQLRALTELKKQNPDVDKIEGLLKDFNPSEKRKILSGKSGNIKPFKSLDDARKDNIESKDENVSGVRKDFEVRGNVLVQKAENIRKNPPRYLGSLISKEGKRFPFIIKRYSTIVQIQVNANIPKEYKNKIDIGDISTRAVEKAQEKFGKYSNRWAWDIIRKESGGHRYGIWNISALGTLSAAGLTGAEREETRYINKYKERVSKLQGTRNRKAELMKTKGERLKELDTKKQENSLLAKSLDFIIDEITNELNRKYGHVKVGKFRDDYDIKKD